MNVHDSGAIWGIFVKYCDILYRKTRSIHCIFYFILSTYIISAVSRLIDLKGD